MLAVVAVACGPSWEERRAAGDRVVAQGRAPVERQLSRFEALLPALRAAPAATAVRLPSGVRLAFEGGNALFLELEQLEHLRETEYHTRLGRMTHEVPFALRVLEFGVGGLDGTPPDTIEDVRRAVTDALDRVVRIRYLLIVRVWDLVAPGVTAIHPPRPGEAPVEIGAPLAEFSGGHLVGDALLVDVESGDIVGTVPFDVRSSFQVEMHGPTPLLDDLTRHMVNDLNEALAPIRTGSVY